MTPQLSLRLRLMLLLWALIFVGGLVSQSAFGHNAHPRATIVYDGTSLPLYDYDSASTLPANESEGRIREEGGFFAQFGEFLAAKGLPVGYRGGPGAMWSGESRPLLQRIHPDSTYASDAEAARSLEH